MSIIGALAACGDDATTFEVSIFASTDKLSASGTDSSTLTISVLSNKNDPPEAGTQIVLSCTIDGVSGGSLASSGEAVSPLLFTDGQGFAEDFVSCTTDGTLLCIAVMEGADPVPSPPIDCQAEEE